MIIQNLHDLRGSQRYTSRPNWDSTRLIVADDQMGFSLHVTRIFPGETGLTEYPEHVEAAYCLSGRATLIYDDGATRTEIAPGVVYALNQHDPHRMVVHEELNLVCVFNPPLAGSENVSASAAKEAR
ncbi:L-ectoine synthase [Roseobacter cerasinus]|uniref:L-ectoine synthase n=1 Tax=Roseobacter cerasinus TaxID=2602289 RepID=A0A640VW71_9RHOB|nr:ectoine synthase [Roseobacter cerasinus]GFE51854.1 L-ectoine synthase [Roseobacter cerasinus]